MPFTDPQPAIPPLVLAALRVQLAALEPLANASRFVAQAADSLRIAIANLEQHEQHAGAPTGAPP